MAQAGAKKKKYTNNPAQPGRSQPVKRSSKRSSNGGDYSRQIEAVRRIDRDTKNSTLERKKAVSNKTAPKRSVRQTTSISDGMSQRTGQEKPVIPASRAPAPQRSLQKPDKKMPQKTVQKPVKKASKRRADIEYRRRMREQIKRKEKINRIMLWITGGVIAAALFVYVDRMADLSAVSKQINQLRAGITELEEQKQYKEVELAAAQNIDRVSDEAIGRLGMITPSLEQTRYISISEYLD